MQKQQSPPNASCHPSQAAAQPPLLCLSTTHTTALHAYAGAYTVLVAKLLSIFLLSVRLLFRAHAVHSCQLCCQSASQLPGLHLFNHPNRNELRTHTYACARVPFDHPCAYATRAVLLLLVCCIPSPQCPGDHAAAGWVFSVWC